MQVSQRVTVLMYVREVGYLKSASLSEPDGSGSRLRGRPSLRESPNAEDFSK
jgi:hypothetical protein